MRKVKMDNLGIPPLAGLCTYDDACKPGYSVDQSVELLKRLNYVEKEIHSIFTAHIARTPEWEVKCALGYHIWLDAEHSAAIRKRVSELREPPLHLDRVPDEHLKLWLDEAIQAENSVELLTSIYRVVKPELVKAMRQYLAETNPVADQPTCRLLRIIVQEEEEMIAWGEQALTALVNLSHAEQQCHEWEQHLQSFLKAAGGVFGGEKRVNHTLKPRSTGRKYEMDPVPKRDERFIHPFNRSALIDAYYKDESRPLDERVYALIYKRLREMDVPEWMGPILYKTEGKPWAYYADLSRQLWDETRHAMLGEIGLYYGGVPFYKYPIDLKASMMWNTEFEPHVAHLILWRIEQSLMPKNTGKQWEWEIAKQSGNPIATLIQDYDWADEVLHAQIGRKWVVPDYGSIAEANEEANRKIAEKQKLQDKLLELSDQTEWWPSFMEEIRDHAKETAAPAH